MKIRSIVMAGMAAGALLATATPALASDDNRNPNASREITLDLPCEDIIIPAAEAMFSAHVEMGLVEDTRGDGLPSDEWLVREDVGGIGMDYAICTDRFDGIDSDWGGFAPKSNNENNRYDKGANSDHRNPNGFRNAA